MKRFILFFLLLWLPLIAEEQDVPKLTLSATGTIWKPADELQMKIGVISLATTAEEALADNSAKMQAIIDQLGWVGLDKDDYETAHFSINPTYTPYPKNPPPDWKRSIIGYEVTNSLLIHTGKLDLIGRVIDAANQAGANTLTDLRFGLRSSRAYWTDAIVAAAHNAVSDANAIAEATGVKLVRVLSINLNQTHVHAKSMSVAAFANDAMGAAPPIEAGDVALDATISMIYEITN